MSRTRMNKINALVVVLILVAGMLASCSEFSRLQKRGDITAKLEGGIKFYNKKDYYKSSVLLEEIAPLLKGRAEAEQALYYLAYDYYQQEQYPMASFYFKELYTTYNRSTYHEEAMFMNAKALYKESPAYNLDQQSTFESLKAIQTFINRYPQSTYVTECNAIMDELTLQLERKEYEHAKLYNKIHNYKSAIVALTAFMEQYPNSSYNEEIALTRVEAQYHLAKNSIVGKVQIERYYDAIGFYRSFAEKFPSSKYLAEAKQYAEMSESELAKIKSKS
ncbi:MAG: repeat protein [Chitinophagaceae bacterium]|nr:repeat protein [Chitinophagaceae bacterium]